MGNRMTEGRCLRCDFELLDLNSYFCTSCQKIINEQVKEKVRHRKDKGTKRIKMNIGMLGKLQKIKNP